MRILFIGDIFARPGRDTVKELLPGVLDEHKPHMVIANGENLSHGNGISPDNAEDMRRAGINFFTTGNHIWGNKDGVMKLNDPKFPVIRPANFPSTKTPGRGYEIIEDGMMNKILVVNMMGRVFMREDLDCPFRTMERILEETTYENVQAIFVDFHAEATSEKSAFAHHFDGKVSAVVGTHTHVQTADEKILDGGTAFISDVGMTGSMDSVIGVNKDLMINKFITQLPSKFDPEMDGEMALNAVLIEVDEKSKKALSIQRIQVFN